MEILLARDMGFCWGVRRAINIMEEAVEERGPIASLGPIVHNPQVVKTLAEKGVQITDPSGADSLPVAITAHGVGPEVLEEMRANGSEIIDTTCPIVTRSQRWARKMAEGGFTVIVFGDPQHREVKGVLGWSGEKGFALNDGEPLPDELPSRLAVIAQTTQSPERFAAFVWRLMRERMGEISELRVVNTMCGVTSSQQAAARELAREVDVMLVVGGKNSANTRHLLEACREEGAIAYHVESAQELKPDWFLGCRRVGVTAGASTPDSAVEAVVEQVRETALALESPLRREEALKP